MSTTDNKNEYHFTEASVVADSIGACPDSRVVTFILTYPRFIHGQMMTHRMAARNAQSSRAVPVAKMIRQALYNPVYPVAFLANQRGMVAGDEVRRPDVAMREWVRGSRSAAHVAEALAAEGVHKQHVNRILEPYLTITSVFTFEIKWLTHFFGLRMAHDAQPEIQSLAQKMFAAVSDSRPAVLAEGQWHTPLMTPKESYTGDKVDVARCSAARCARASYLNFGGTRDTVKDLELYDMLVADGHMSPLEHALTPAPKGTYGVFEHWESLRFHNENPLD